MHNILQLLTNFLYPPRCPACHAYVEQEGDWCAVCLKRTAYMHLLPLIPDSSLDKAWSLGRYHSVLRSLIIALKYKGKKSALPGIHTYIEAAASAFPLTEKIDAAVCVPLYKERLKERGFNQTELIFSEYLNRKKIPLSFCLERTRFTEKQNKLKRKDRIENVRNAFALCENFSVKGDSILLLDDIYTTGATMEACAHVLRKKGAAKIYGLVLASDA